MDGPELNNTLNRLVFLGGPPRSGTTLAMRILEGHPDILGISDDHVHESWPLYYYGDHSGLVADLRRGIDSESARSRLLSELIPNGFLEGIADSPYTEMLPLSSLRQRPDGRILPADKERVRRACPPGSIPRNTRICLKSPEITHVLPQLAEAFPGALFVLVFRPIPETAESMFRMGNRVSKVAVFHKRWRRDEAAGEENAIPPAIPPEWRKIWSESEDFPRCVMNAASYIRAIAEYSRHIPEERLFVYNHADLRSHPERILAPMADFLKIDSEPLIAASGLVRRTFPEIPADLVRESGKWLRRLGMDQNLHRIEQLAGRSTG